jgi:hypothetical protein
MVTRFVTSPPTDNCPQPKEAQPLSQLDSALWSDGPEVALNWLFPFPILPAAPRASLLQFRIGSHRARVASSQRHPLECGELAPADVRGLVEAQATHLLTAQPLVSCPTQAGNDCFCQTTHPCPPLCACRGSSRAPGTCRPPWPPRLTCPGTKNKPDSRRYSELCLRIPHGRTSLTVRSLSCTRAFDFERPVSTLPSVGSFPRCFVKGGKHCVPGRTRCAWVCRRRGSPAWRAWRWSPRSRPRTPPTPGDDAHLTPPGESTWSTQAAPTHNDATEPRLLLS